MANKALQYRFYNDSAGSNQPSGKITMSSLTNGSVFTEGMPIIQLGIQTLPGTQFYLNNSTEPITVGGTGIYELDVSIGAVITALRFDYRSVQIINDQESAYLIVDTIYEGE